MSPKMIEIRQAKKGGKGEGGYILVGVVVLMAVAALIISMNLDLASSNASTTYAEIKRSQEFYRAEESLGAAASWLRTYSTSLSSIFSRNMFYNKFSKSATPSVGANDTSIFNIPTAIKIRGTNNSAILTSSGSLASAAFPTTIDTVSGNTFTPASFFASASMGLDSVRATLVDAVPVDPAKDYGDPATGAQPPATDFNPIYRIDAMRSVDGGGHVFGYFIGSLVFNYGVGFYGKEFLEMKQPCDSYLSNAGVYGGNNKRANCATGSDGAVKIQGTEELYGTVRTKGSITTTSPWGGKVCADLNCTKQGQICQGAQCTVDGFGNYSKLWSSYENNNANLGDWPFAGCNNFLPAGYWNKVTVGNGVQLTLSSSAASPSTYYIKTFDISNNNATKVLFSISNNRPVSLYVLKFVGDKFNASQVFNANNKPYNLRVYYLGIESLTVNGNANMSMFLEAPNAYVTVSGNGTYSGGIKAKGLYLHGNASVHFDESGDITTVSDVSFKLRDVVARYR